MTFVQKLVILTLIAIVIALAALTRARAGRRSPARPAATSLAVITLALLAVGIVSHTLVRHIIQVTPLVVAIALVFRRPALAVVAAMPLFAFWLLLMASIWLFLLGVARIFTGTFTQVEITLTIIVGLASAVGLGAACRRGAGALSGTRITTIVAFAVLQFAAMWASVQSFVVG